MKTDFFPNTAGLLFSTVLVLSFVCIPFSGGHNLSAETPLPLITRPDFMKSIHPELNLPGLNICTGQDRIRRCTIKLRRNQADSFKPLISRTWNKAGKPLLSRLFMNGALLQTKQYEYMPDSATRLRRFRIFHNAVSNTKTQPYASIHHQYSNDRPVRISHYEFGDRLIQRRYYQYGELQRKIYYTSIDSETGRYLTNTIVRIRRNPEGQLLNKNIKQLSGDRKFQYSIRYSYYPEGRIRNVRIRDNMGKNLGEKRFLYTENMDPLRIRTQTNTHILHSLSYSYTPANTIRSLRIQYNDTDNQRSFSSWNFQHNNKHDPVKIIHKTERGHTTTYRYAYRYNSHHNWTRCTFRVENQGTIISSGTLVRTFLYFRKKQTSENAN